MEFTLRLVLICIGILAVAYVILLAIDRYKYNKKLNSCGNYIPLNMIPIPSRIIHYCIDLENIRYSKGDILILNRYEYNEFKMKADPVTRYYIASEFGKLIELHPAQVDRIEKLYNMKIRESK